LFLDKLPYFRYLFLIDSLPQLSYSDFIFVMEKYYCLEVIVDIIFTELLFYSISVFGIILIYSRYIEKLGPVIITKLGKKRFLLFLAKKTLALLFSVLTVFMILTLVIESNYFSFISILSFFIRFFIITSSMTVFMMTMIMQRNVLYSLLMSILVYAFLNLSIFVYFNLVVSQTVLSSILFLLMIIAINLGFVKILRDYFGIHEII